MPSSAALMAFGLVALAMVLTPGPNMIYLVSRTICQGRNAGFVSLIGVAAGFLFYMVCAAFGITAFVMAVPYAYDALRVCGALYLFYLAWQAVGGGGRAPFEVRNLPPDGAVRLFTMGFLTNLLNPKIAVMYLSLLPQFIDPAQGSPFAQSLVLGGTQLMISLFVNSLIILTAGGVARVLATRPAWALVQRWLMASVLSSLALRMVLEGRQ